MIAAACRTHFAAHRDDKAKVTEFNATTTAVCGDFKNVIGRHL